jgi:hypothetical protein
VLAAELPGCGAQFLANAADGLPDVLGYLPGNVAQRLGELVLKVGQVGQPAVDLLAALVGDAVDLLAVDFLMGHEAVFFKPGQSRIDGAGRGCVHAEEPVLEQPDYLVSVPR